MYDTDTREQTSGFDTTTRAMDVGNERPKRSRTMSIFQFQSQSRAAEIMWPPTAMQVRLGSSNTSWSAWYGSNDRDRIAGRSETHGGARSRSCGRPERGKQ